MTQDQQEAQLVAIRSLGMKELLILITVIINFAGIVWGAAVLQTSVRQLTTTVELISISVNSLNLQIQTVNLLHSQRLTALEEHNRGDVK